MPGVADVLCGGLCLGHSEALAGTVNRLFNIVQPDLSSFGEKDFGQLVLIRRMVEEVRMPINVVGAPVVRTPDGLTMSSRNQYLSEEERKVALRIYEELSKAAEAIETESPALSEIMQLESKSRAALTAEGFKVDYFSVVSINSLR